MWKGSDIKKTKRLTQVEVKKELIESMVNNEVMETDEVNKQTEKVQKPENAADLIKYEEERNHKYCISSRQGF